MATHHNFMTVQGAIGLVVPQQVYQGPKTTDNLGPNVTFVQYNTVGVLMESASHQAFCRGDVQSTHMPDGTTESDIRHNNQMIKIRILWPGCASYEQSIVIEEHVAGECRNVSKAVLAHKVANVVRNFREKYTKTASFDAKWAPERYQFNQYVLLELHNVSPGSYQPVIAISAQ